MDTFQIHDSANTRLPEWNEPIRFKRSCSVSQAVCARIRQGKVNWAGQWTPEEIEAGRYAEESRRKAYYDALYVQSRSSLREFWNWLKGLFNR